MSEQAGFCCAVLLVYNYMSRPPTKRKSELRAWAPQFDKLRARRREGWWGVFCMVGVHTVMVVVVVDRDQRRSLKAPQICAC